jgi:PKD repeat protein
MPKPAKTNTMKQLLMCLWVLLAVSANAQNKLSGYEYWFDGLVAQKKVHVITPVAYAELNLQISTDNLSSGLHTLNIRFRDTNNQYSNVLSSFFYKEPLNASSTFTLEKCQYWFDNDYSNQTTIDLPSQGVVSLSQAFDLTNLPGGLHTIHIRFKDSAHKWSSVSSSYFYKIAESSGTNVLESAEIWFDHNYGDKTILSLPQSTTVTLNEAIDATLLSDGLHTVHARFRDTKGQWSSLVSSFFYKQPAGILDNHIGAYEYWFDNELDQAVSAIVEPTTSLMFNAQPDASALATGLHVLHIRFKDKNNKWSSALSSFFYKLPVASALPNKINGYRYWATGYDDQMVSATLPEPVNPYQFAVPIDLTQIPSNSYSINFQFRDINGTWSSVLTEEIFKEILPLARFEPDAPKLCNSGSVTFANKSVDADAFEWDFGDGNISSDISPTHTYSQPGKYTVTLKVTHTASGKTNTTQLVDAVVVFERPSANVALTGNTVFCQGNVLEASTAEGFSYLWSNGATSHSIQIVSSGKYSVTVMQPDFTTCQSVSDDIDVTVNNNPVVNLGGNRMICEGTNLLLDAFNENSTYLWNTGSDQPTLTVSNSGKYWVTVTNSHNCSAFDEMILDVDPLPIVAFEQEINGLTVSFTNNSLHANSYNWSFGDGQTSEAISPSHAFAEQKAYMVELTGINACGTRSVSMVVNLDPNSTEQRRVNAMMAIYPNPVGEELNVAIELAKTTHYNLYVADLQGKPLMMLHKDRREAGSFKLTLDVTNLASGSYLLVLDPRNGKKATAQFIKVK